MLVVIESGLQNRKLSVDKMSLDGSQKMDGMPEETVCLCVGVCRENLQFWKILWRKLGSLLFWSSVFPLLEMGRNGLIIKC